MSLKEFIQKRTIISTYINNLHNQQQTQNYKIFHAFNNIQSYQLLIIKLLNLSLNKLPYQSSSNKTIYHEDNKYVINPLVRNVGLITRFLAQYIKFENNIEKQLAQFETIQFYKHIQRQMPYFINYLIGIFPKVNVHKQNLPLYMPLYESIQNYINIGNPNWQMSRVGLQQIYKQQILGNNCQSNHQSHVNPIQQDLWYLMLTGDHRIQQRVDQQSILSRIWSIMYIFYIHMTLRPYRIFEQEQSSQNQIYELNSVRQFLIHIKRIIKQELGKQTNNNQTFKQNKLILNLIMDILTQSGDNYQYFNNSWEQFENKFSNILNYEICQLNKININDGNQLNNKREERLLSNNIKKQDQQYDIKLCNYGLINTQFNQLNRNIKQSLLIHKYDNIYYNNIKIFNNIHKRSLKFNQKLLRKNIIFADYYLRIFYPSRQIDQRIIQQQREDTQKSQQKIIDIFRQLILSDQYKGNNPYPMFQYPNYSHQLYEKLSLQYINKYPALISQVIPYLPKEKLIWLLLSAQSLEKYQVFVRIKQNIFDSNNINQYINIVNKSNKNIRIQQFQRFIQQWQDYHKFIKYNTRANIQPNQYSKRIVNCMQYLCQLQKQSANMIIKSLQCINTPFKSHNIRINIINILINSIQKFFQYGQNQQSSAQINKICLQMVQSQWFQKSYLSILDQETKQYFWKAYSCVMLNSQHIVKGIIRQNLQNINQQKSQIYSNQHQYQHQNRQNQAIKQSMQLE